MGVRWVDTRNCRSFNAPNAVYPCSTWRAIACRILPTDALPQALLDNCHKPVQRRGAMNGPIRNVSRGGSVGAAREAIVVCRSISSDVKLKYPTGKQTRSSKPGVERELGGKPGHSIKSNIPVDRMTKYRMPDSNLSNRSAESDLQRSSLRSL
jgi:hypothetical protein